MHPAAGRKVLQRVADGHAVAAHDGIPRDGRERHLVALRDLLEEREPGPGNALRKHGAGRQPAVVGDDGHVVVRVHADRERGTGGGHGIWRRGPESNRRRRICNPLHNHFATAPAAPGNGPAGGLKRSGGRMDLPPKGFWSGERASNTRPLCHDNQGAIIHGASRRCQRRQGPGRAYAPRGEPEIAASPSSESANSWFTSRCCISSARTASTTSRSVAPSPSFQ